MKMLSETQSPTLTLNTSTVEYTEHAKKKTFTALKRQVKALYGFGG